MHRDSRIALYLMGELVAALRANGTETFTLPLSKAVHERRWPMANEFLNDFCIVVICRLQLTQKHSLFDVSSAYRCWSLHNCRPHRELAYLLILHKWKSTTGSSDCPQRSFYIHYCSTAIYMDWECSSWIFWYQSRCLSNSWWCDCGLDWAFDVAFADATTADNLFDETLLVIHSPQLARHFTP